MVLLLKIYISILYLAQVHVQLNTYLAGPHYDSMLVLGCRSHYTIKFYYFIRYSLSFEGNSNWTNIFINTKEVLMICKLICVCICIYSLKENVTRFNCNGTYTCMILGKGLAYVHVSVLPQFLLF